MARSCGSSSRARTHGKPDRIVAAAAAVVVAVVVVVVVVVVAAAAVVVVVVVVAAEQCQTGYAYPGPQPKELRTSGRAHSTSWFCARGIMGVGVGMGS